MAWAKMVTVKMERKRCIQNIAQLELVNELFGGDGHFSLKVRIKNDSQVIWLAFQLRR